MSYLRSRTRRSVLQCHKRLRVPTRSTVNVFGSEKRIEYLCLNLFINANPGVGDREHYILTWKHERQFCAASAPTVTFLVSIVSVPRAALHPGNLR